MGIFLKKSFANDATHGALAPFHVSAETCGTVAGGSATQGRTSQVRRVGVPERVHGRGLRDVGSLPSAGENVLYLSVAVSNLKLTKKKKKAFQYLPVALVVSGVKKAATTDIAKMADLKGLVFELEAFDSVSGERLVAIIDSRGEQKNPSSWEELVELMALYGGRLQCRLGNAKLPPDQQVNCLTKK